MTVYAVGGEADTFILPSGMAYVHETADAGTRYESTLSRGAMVVTQGASELALDMSTTLSAFWLHMYIYQEAITAQTDWITFRNSTGDTREYALDIDGSGFLTAQRDKGGLTSLGTTSAAAIQPNTGQAIDIYVNRTTSGGSFEIYRNGTALLTFSGDSDSDLAPDTIYFKGLLLNTREMNLSQVIVADESTIGWKLATLSPDGNGNNTAWTGDYTAIDEFAYSAADFIETNSTSQTETSTLSNINAAFSTYNVKAVAVALRCSNDSGSSVNDIQAVLRTAATDYPSSNLGVVKDGTEQSVQNIWQVDPNTTVAWTQTNVNGLEAGVKSV